METDVGIGLAVVRRVLMTDHADLPEDPPPFLTCLWELSDGLRACVVEHHSAPRWELWVTRRNRVVHVSRWDTIPELMARSLAEFAAASERGPGTGSP